MKKWWLVCLLGVSLHVAASETDDLCQSTAEFGGEVFELRQAGVGQATALSLVQDVLHDVGGEERIIAGQVLNLVVNGVYDMDLDGLESLSKAETAYLKKVFVDAIREECSAKR